MILNLAAQELPVKFENKLMLIPEPEIFFYPGFKDPLVSISGSQNTVFEPATSSPANETEQDPVDKSLSLSSTSLLVGKRFSLLDVP